MNIFGLVFFLCAFKVGTVHLYLSPKRMPLFFMRRSFACAVKVSPALLYVPLKREPFTYIFCSFTHVVRFRVLRYYTLKLLNLSTFFVCYIVLWICISYVASRVHKKLFHSTKHLKMQQKRRVLGINKQRHKMSKRLRHERFR